MGRVHLEKKMAAWFLMSFKLVFENKQNSLFCVQMFMENVTVLFKYVMLFETMTNVDQLTEILRFG